MLTAIRKPHRQPLHTAYRRRNLSLLKKPKRQKKPGPSQFLSISLQMHKSEPENQIKQNEVLLLVHIQSVPIKY